MPLQPDLPWLNPGDAFPDASYAWPSHSDAPGLLAAGGRLDTGTLVNAYSQGIFPWFSQGHPILWWSTDPRMVLVPQCFRLHRSLRKTLSNFIANPACQIRVDSDFDAVIENCSKAERNGQSGTWIVPEMVAAYRALHRQDFAHSIETWIDGELVGGLYCVSIGQAVFGESMFAHRSDASKLALAALVGLCQAQGVTQIDCQQNTRHLQTLGAGEISRARFVNQVQQAITLPALKWTFDPLYWTHILDA